MKLEANKYSEELKIEEQRALDEIIRILNDKIDELDDHTQDLMNKIEEAKQIGASDPLSAVPKALSSIEDNEQTIGKLQVGKDALFNIRMLLEYKDRSGEKKCGTEEFRVGLHTCQIGSDFIITRWVENPLCRHYVLNDLESTYTSKVVDKYGNEYLTDYKLLVKNDLKIRFDKLQKAINSYPGVYDEEFLQMTHDNSFYSDKYVEKMMALIHDNLENNEPLISTGSSVMSRIVFDEFLRELQERRADGEFRNIVFSIQKKQSQIIQASMKKNMIIQGCAGSGKSMIMLHRLPIVLFDNPQTLKRNNLYIITPSELYIQMVDSMRDELEISDISMGTLKQYYDYCIEKYQKDPSEYGKRDSDYTLSNERRDFVYSDECVEQIKMFFEAMLEQYDETVLLKGMQMYKVSERHNANASCSSIMSSYILVTQKIIEANRIELEKIYRTVREAITSVKSFNMSIKSRQSDIEKCLRKKITEISKNIERINEELSKLDEEKNEKAIINKNEILQGYIQNKENLMTEFELFKKDSVYFDSIENFGIEIEKVLEPFLTFNSMTDENTEKDIYMWAEKTTELINGYYKLMHLSSQLEEKYDNYVDSIDALRYKMQQSIDKLQVVKANTLSKEEYEAVADMLETLRENSNNGIQKAYAFIMSRVDRSLVDEKGIKAIEDSPYLYLQTLYCYYGAPNARKESMLSIDEAQGMAPNEIKLLYNLNENKVIFNLFGDVNQHIEGSKGVNSWEELDEVCKFTLYEMNENYRNASQITNYCNKKFGMKMLAINLPGEGVEEINTQEELRKHIWLKILEKKDYGLTAVIVKNEDEAKKVLNLFEKRRMDFHDTTKDGLELSKSKINIITIENAKGLEFTSVYAITRQMSKNEKYIAYTRALNNLIIYEGNIDDYHKDDKTINKEEALNKKVRKEKDIEIISEKQENKIQWHYNSLVKDYFEKVGLEVVDNRPNGRLWVIGNKKEIEKYVNNAVEKFNISGQYAMSKEINNRSGWCTKTKK